MDDTASYTDLHTDQRRNTVYYWVHPDTGAALYHTGVGEDTAIPFFDDVGAAETYLEQRAERDDSNEYDQYSLYEAKTRKVMDAVDVLTDQSGIVDFGDDD